MCAQTAMITSSLLQIVNAGVNTSLAVGSNQAVRVYVHVCRAYGCVGWGGV